MNISTTERTGEAQFPLDEFPILQHGHYMNHAAIAPWPRCAARAVQEFARENAAIAADGYKHWLRREKQLRGMLAGMLNAESTDDIALLKNTTEGISTVASGINWRNGDNIVIPQGEFPSNRLPWLALDRFGVEVREVDIRAPQSPERALVKHMDARTRLLAVSAVQWTDGLRLKLEQLGTQCKTNGVLFFVDAIQQLGAMQMDVQTCNIDFLAADGHKWLLAPEGIAVFYCAQGVRTQLRLQQHGWHMADEPYRFERERWLPSNTASRFEAGSPNMLGQAALHASLGLMEGVGLHQIEASIVENSRALTSVLNDINGVQLVRPYDPGRVSGIVSFRLPGYDPEGLHQALKCARIECSLRGGAIRLSPHFYQTGQPLQRMLDVLEQVIKTII